MRVTSHRVLLVDDDSLFVDATALLLRANGLHVETASTLGEAMARDPGSFDYVVIDHHLPDGEGLTLATKFASSRPRLVLVSAAPPLAAALSAVRLGVAAFLQKPIEFAELFSILQADRWQPRPQSATLLPSFESQRAMLEAVASSPCPVLVTGDTGVGKGYLARQIHALSGKANLVEVNCAAIPVNLVEAELFGVERGAFTGAESRAGLLEEASGGTIFLDELGELPLSLQSKLLTFLDSGVIRRVGGVTPKQLDVRVIGATNMNLERSIEEGRFRADLFHRLDVARFDLSPLRERPRDLPLLVAEILARLTQRDGRTYELASGELERLAEHDWPGNVRELSNTLERATLVSRPNALRPTLTLRRAANPTPVEIHAETPLPLDLVERAHVLRVLEANGGNRTRAAQALGMGLSTLRRKLKEWSV